MHGLRNAAASGDERERGEFAASLRLLGFLVGERRGLEGTQAAGERHRCEAGRSPDRGPHSGAARKDFKESDRIRDELAAMGVAIKDGKDADGKPVTTWEIAR